MDDDIFADMPLLDEQLADDKTPFVPAGNKQRQKNKNRKEQRDRTTNAPTAQPTIVEPRMEQPVQVSKPIAAPAPTSEPASTVSPTQALDILIDKVPDLFESGAQISEAIGALLPVKPVVRVAIVAAAAGLAVYLSTRRDN